MEKCKDCIHHGSCEYEDPLDLMGCLGLYYVSKVL